ncbi:MAG: hypothetical protein PHN41_05390 [Bacteroidales bacterium]|nr:hypothetical protein [Bacteroidales bacterium]MDD4703740.1 hypothetical protein [Bacteroidales bacterium]MDX9797223.1 hypothetical protein [Bacteroidales bacterium]
MKHSVIYIVIFVCLFSFNSKSFAFAGGNELSLSPDKSIPITKKSINIAMFLSLSYDRISELDFTKFNIEDKKRLKYRCFEYITFYEGARIALDKLEKEGYNVSLYVYDVGEEDVNEMKKVLEKPEMKSMDLIIPLVFQKCFTIAADYALKHEIPIINPMSPNPSIVVGNPFVFKIQPSSIADVETTVRYIRNKFTSPNIILLFSPKEKALMEMYQRAIERENWTWCGVDYNKYPNRIFEKVDPKKDNIFISILDKGSQQTNEAYANTLLMKLNNNKGLPPINLIAQYDWLDYPSLDLRLLEKFNFHFTLSYLNDYTNQNFVEFVKEFRNHFRQEPDKIYAALGYDIMMYFVPVIQNKGKSFSKEPNEDRSKFMINSYLFDRRDPNDGWQNRRTVIYKISDYKIISVGR